VAYPAPFVARTERERSIVQRARTAAELAAPHRARHDRHGSFPTEGLAALAESGYLALVIPPEFGGEGASVTEMLLGSLELGQGDASLALVVAMHAAFLGRVRDARLWPAATFERVASTIAIARDGTGALINSLATEPEMGSPSRGGLPRTTAGRDGDGWAISGRKTFSSGAPVLRWGVVSAAAETDGESRVASFLVPMDARGVSVEPSWDSMGMRATGSHTVVLERVRVSAADELPRGDAGQPSGPLPYERAWSLVVAGVYVGVAEAARDFAFGFARERKPTALQGKSIASVPHIRQRAGQIDLLLYQARGLLVSTARAWDAQPAPDLDTALAAAKVTAANQAVQAVEQAMRLVGGSSMDRSLPLEQHYRDVRGGLHHPPQDDAALDLFAKNDFD
jgi:alkylation response protein AidB-like acyl-CoA dehydrogenase